MNFIISDVRRKIEIMYLLLGILSNLSYTFSWRPSNPCNNMQDLYQYEGSNTSPIQGVTSQVCKREVSCCTDEMEANFARNVTDYIKENIKNMSEVLEILFVEEHDRFDNFFIELLERARSSLDVLFYETYGNLYSDNSAVFMDLFSDFKAYYRGSVLHLSEIFNSFFIDVMQMVIKLINSKYFFDEEYLHCIADNTDILKQYSAMPQVISLQLQRAIFVARTFTKSLQAGRNLASLVAKFHPTKNCIEDLTRMSVCAKCSGYVSVKPCGNYCLNVMKACLTDYLQLNQVWNEYIDAILLLSKPLETSSNMVSVLQPFDVILSKAIMNLQENGKNITAGIFSICGKPQEKANMTNLHYDVINYDRENPDYDEPFDDVGKLDDRNRGLRSSFTSDDYSGHSSDDGGELDDYDVVKGRKLSNSEAKRLQDGNRSKGKGGWKHAKTNRKNQKTKLSIGEENRPKLDRFNIEQTRKEDETKEEKRHNSICNVLATDLVAMVTSVKKMLKDAKDSWIRIPELLCSKEAKELGSDICWNGEKTGKYVTPQLKQEAFGTANQHVQGEVISGQIKKLKETTLHLYIADSGVDPLQPIFDDDEEISEEYGSGSGAEQSGKIEEVVSESPVASCPTCGAAVNPSSTIVISLLLAFLLYTIV